MWLNSMSCSRVQSGIKEEKKTACIVKYIKINFQTHLKEKNLKRKMEFKSQGDEHKD